MGAGPAGVSAAGAAASAGRDVLLIDDNVAAGGQIWRRGGSEQPERARRLIQGARDAGVRFVDSTSIVDAPESTRLIGYAETTGEMRQFQCDRLILATGSRELYVPFPGWTLPGVHGAGGLQALAKGGWPVDGQRVVVAGSGPLLLAVAAYLRGAGAHVVAIAEQVSLSRVARFATGTLKNPGKLRQAAQLGWQLAGVPKWFGAWPTAARGDGRLEQVAVRHGSRARLVDCDLLACGFGLVPNSEIAAFLGCALTPDGGVQVDGYQETDAPGVYAVGELAGVGGVDVALGEGRVAGFAAADDARSADREAATLRRERAFATRLQDTFALRSELRELTTSSTLVCRCEDISWAELESFDDARDAKLKTRCGMGPCQGRVCGPALSFLHGWGPDRIRPPFFPVPMAALASPASQPEE